MDTAMCRRMVARNAVSIQAVLVSPCYPCGPSVCSGPAGLSSSIYIYLQTHHTLSMQARNLVLYTGFPLFSKLYFFRHMHLGVYGEHCASL